MTVSYNESEEALRGLNAALFVCDCGLRLVAKAGDRSLEMVEKGALKHIADTAEPEEEHDGIIYQYAENKTLQRGNLWNEETEVIHWE